MRRRTLRFYLHVLIAAVPAIALIPWQSLPQDLQLLELSQKITSPEDWSSVRTPGQEQAYYLWLNQNELLRFRESDGELPGVRLKVDGLPRETEIPWLKIPSTTGN